VGALPTSRQWHTSSSLSVGPPVQIGTGVVVLPYDSNNTNLFVVNLKTGQVVNKIRVDTNDSSQAWAVPGPRREEMLFVYPNHVLAMGLPETPHRPAGQAHDRPYWPAISLQDNRLWIVDCNGVLQVLDVDDGQLVASILLTIALSNDGSLPVATRMVNMPWRARDVLIAPTEPGVAGYRLPEALQAAGDP
jgi:hypothetical protein